MNFTEKIKNEIAQKCFEREDEFTGFSLGYLNTKSNGHKQAYPLEEKDQFLTKILKDIKLKDCSITDFEFLINFNQTEFLENSDNSVKRAYLSGAFYSSGNITDPVKAYHFEITTKTEEEASYLEHILKDFNILAKTIKRSNGQSLVYVKESSWISDILTMIGAIKATLYFEEKMVLRSARNDTNRRVNCETANLSKTIEAGVRQVMAIEKLKEEGIFEKLDDTLYETGLLRLANPDASLKELAILSGNKISKSGINHRLQKLIELAEEIR